MKKIIRVLALILAIFTLFSILTTGCGTETNNEQPVDSSATEVSGEFKLIEDGKPLFTIIRPDSADSDSAVVTSAKDIRTAYGSATTDFITIDTDYVKKGAERSSETFEILIGQTVSKESLEINNQLRFGDYAVKAVGNKIVITSLSDTGIKKATSDFIAVLSAAIKAGDGKNVSIKKSELNTIKAYDTFLSSLPVYENGTFAGTYITGNGCKELFVNDTTPEAYAAYVEKLKAEGYTVSRTHSVKNNEFCTLCSSKTTINIAYYAFDKSVTIITENYSAATEYGLEKDNNYEIVTTSQLTMLGQGYIGSDNEEKTNGLNILIRLAGGRFIIIDGGFNTANNATTTINEIKEQAKDYSDKTGLKIAAWIVTHAHGDHVGMLYGKYSKFVDAGIEVQAVISNVASEAELERARTSSKYGENWAATEGNASDDVLATADKLGALNVAAHVGQIYYFADLECEVLYTLESYAPQILNAFNTTSVIMKLTFTDPATKEKTVYISNGDATGPALAIVSAMYGDYLKADITQVAHHGFTTWGNQTGTMTSYKLEAPATVIFPVGFGSESNVKAREYNQVLLFPETNPNFAEVYTAGNLGDKIIFQMPYKVGTAIVVRK